MKIAERVLAATVIVAAAASIAPTAQAGSLWLYDNANYDSVIGQFWSITPLRNISSANNDKLSSWSNQTGWNAAWYEHANGNGFCRNMPANSSNAYVGFWDNDKASSFKLGSGC